MSGIILVTGATGNIGRHVVAGLVKAGRPVRAMSRDPERARLLLPDGVEVVRGGFIGDHDDDAAWSAALHGVERVSVFPFAYLAPESGSSFVERAADAGVSRFVTHSAAAAGFDDEDESGDMTLSALRRHLAEERETHRGIEQMVERTGADWTHVRPGLLAANALAWAPRVRAEGVVREPYGESAYPVVHEADVAEVMVAALLDDTHVGEAYTITGPADVTQRDQAAAIAAAIGSEVRFEEVTPTEATREWVAGGLPEEWAQWRAELLADGVGGATTLPVTDTFAEVIGRAPRSFTQWARDHADAFTRAGRGMTALT